MVVWRTSERNRRIFRRIFIAIIIYKKKKKKGRIFTERFVRLLSFERDIKENEKKRT